MSAILDGLRQPDQRSCGAAVLVAAQMLHDSAYAELVLTGRHRRTGHEIAGSTPQDRFAAECLAMHQRVTGAVDVRGRFQLPWPQALGTPPWAVAAQLRGSTGTAYRTVLAPGHDRARHLDRIRAATALGRPVPLYVGSEVLPRHVVLVIDPELTTYEPARGRLVRIPERDLLSGRLDLAGWSHHFFTVLPRAV
jgi:hypothetical protein